MFDSFLPEYPPLMMNYLVHHPITSSAPPINANNAQASYPLIFSSASLPRTEAMNDLGATPRITIREIHPRCRIPSIKYHLVKWNESLNQRKDISRIV